MSAFTGYDFNLLNKTVDDFDNNWVSSLEYDFPPRQVCLYRGNSVALQAFQSSDIWESFPMSPILITSCRFNVSKITDAKKGGWESWSMLMGKSASEKADIYRVSLKAGSTLAS